MIVKDSKDNIAQTDMKNSADLLGNPPTPLPLPPSYGTVQAPYLGYSTGNERSGRRWWRACAFALVVWLFLTLFVRTIVDLHLIHRRHQHWSRANDYPEFLSEALQCIDRSNWQSTATDFESQEMMAFHHRPPLHSNTSFSLPLDADLLYFVSRGSLAHGSVNIKLASESSVSQDSVSVDVGVWYWTPDALDRASICALERHENGDQYGVGIFTPRRWPGMTERDKMYFEVVVHLPLGIYKGFETDYENFALHAADLQGSVSFEKIHLKTSNGPIHAGSLEARDGTVKSSNGPISGRYNVTDSLELITSNAVIDTLVEMYSEDSRVTSLLLKSSNGRVHSYLGLHGPPGSSAFDVQALTSNAPAMIFVSTQPPSSPLTLELRTSNSPGRVVMHSAFEGPFTLRTSAFTAPIVRTGPGGLEDPSGEGRERTVEIARQVRGVLEGKVWWGEWTNKEKGWVHITTSNSPVELDLTGKHSG